MSDNNKIEEFLQKIAPCIERGELEACVEEAVRMAREMGIRMRDFGYLSLKKSLNGEHKIAYVLLLGAAKDLEENRKIYLFGWDNIPGNDSLRLIDFLKQNFSLDWIKTAKIEKIDNDRSIRVSTETNFILITLNDESTKVNIKTNDNVSDEFIVENESGRLNIYEKTEVSEIAAAYSMAGFEAKSIGSLKKAEELYKKALHIDPYNENILSGYALYLHEINKKIEADKYYQKSIRAREKTQNKSASTHNNYGVLLADLDRNEEAESQYNKAIEIDPKFAIAHTNYALLLQKLNRKSESEEHYLKAIEINPEDPSMHINYANFLREKTQFYDAEKEARIALQAQPENPYAHGILGDIYADEDYFDEAVAEYQTALKNPNLMKNPTTSEIHNNLGWVYAKREQYYKAESEFKKAKILDPMNVKAFRNHRALGKVRFKNKINIIQIFLGTFLLVSIFISFGLFFWVNKISQTMFIAQSSFLIALLVFTFLYPQLSRFKAGSIEFELSTEHKFMETKRQPELER